MVHPMETIDSSYWNCPICLFPMIDNVVISKRCHHVFHEKCIKESLFRKEECPTCRLPCFTSYELIPNPEFSDGYRQWANDPERYEPVNLKPLELRNVIPERSLSREGIEKYFYHGNAVVKQLSQNATKEQINTAKKVVYNAHQGMLDLAEQKLENQSVVLDKIEAKLDHGNIEDEYSDKIETLDSFIIKELIPSLEKQRPVNINLIEKLLLLSKELIKFNQRFSEASSTDSRTYEESQLLMAQINTELEAFLDSQPQEVLIAIGRVRKPSEEIAVHSSPLSITPPNESQHNSPQKKPTPILWKIAFVSWLVLGAGCFYSYYWSNNNS